MLSKTLGIFIAILSLIVILSACKKNTGPHLNLILKEVGPAKTKAGVAFNMQPDGMAAVWVAAENATEKTAIMWGDTQIRTDYQSPQLLTAPVPAELYAKKGQFQIYLVDTKTGAKSNSLVFIVE